MELQGQEREIYFQVIFPFNAEQSSCSWIILLQARRRHYQQSPGIYDARPGRLGQGRGGERMVDPQCWKGQ